ncbi:MAG TPA: PIG-L family deacetylase, partial [Gemmatimonadaceae bacterium]
MKRGVALAVLGAAVLMSRSVLAQGILPSAASIRAQNAPERMRVLWIAAHPDDEDTQLIAWLARGRRVETAYMSLTRGDGGQNLIGNELGEELGVIRTEELLAARRIDGAHQYFGRAYDFGFSKTADETRKHWPQDSLLNDVMTVMRAFKPHIVITTFSGTPRDGHGQHQISAIVARDAYNLAADTVRFPVKEFGAPWTPSKFYRLARFSPQDRTIAINVG